MELTEGAIVTLRHYSMINVFSSVICGIKDNSIAVRLPRECVNAVFQERDPIVAAYETDSKINIKGGKVLSFKKEQELLVYEEDIPDEGSRMRSYERFPVSLYADYRVAEAPGNKKSFALVKDLSEYGLMIYSRDSHFKGLRLLLDIFLTRDILSLTAEIVRKVELDGYYEYGLKIRHRGPVVFNHIRNFVRKEQEELTGKYSR